MFLSIFSQPKFCHLNEIIYYHISSNKNLGKDFEKFITKLIRYKLKQKAKVEEKMIPFLQV